MTRGLTPSQTVGPFFHLGLSSDRGPLAVSDGTPGAFWIRGAVLDGNGDAVPDALVETWQAGADGRSSSSAEGFARSATDEKGEYGIFTVKPGVEPGTSAAEAPHIEVTVFARGLLTHLSTRIYFEDEASANATDTVLASIADPAARATLIAETTADGYRFDIRLQGEGETAFFAL